MFGIWKRLTKIEKHVGIKDSPSAEITQERRLRELEREFWLIKQHLGIRVSRVPEHLKIEKTKAPQ